MSASLYGNHAWQWLGVVLAAGLSYVVGAVLAWFALAATRRALWHPRDTERAVLFEAARRPLRILLASLVFRESVLPLRVTADLLAAIDHATFTLIVLTLAWFAIRAFRSGVDWASGHLSAEPEDVIERRVHRTQLTVLRQVASALIVVLSIGAVLMQFAFVRSVGLSLLASAGLIGIAFGFAAQKPLTGLIGGIQLSITQPIRIGDTVFIEHELGTIEKIHLTYVVVRLREQRMLVVPVSRFLDAPFENWTIASPDVIGSVLLSVDFTTPVNTVREELARVCAERKEWDQKTCSLDVTDATERTMTLRALVSSSDAAKNWALRCFVREDLIAFLGKLDGGSHLPHDRGDAPPASTAASMLPSRVVARARPGVIE